MTTKTSSVQHTEGPWRVNIWGCEFAQGVIETYAEPVREICHIAKFEVAKDGPTVEANARRIVACVNALEGVSTEDLERGIGGYLELLAETSALREALREAAEMAERLCAPGAVTEYCRAKLANARLR